MDRNSDASPGMPARLRTRQLRLTIKEERHFSKFHDRQMARAQIRQEAPWT